MPWYEKTWPACVRDTGYFNYKAGEEANRGQMVKVGGKEDTGEWGGPICSNSFFFVFVLGRNNSAYVLCVWFCKRTLAHCRYRGWRDVVLSESGGKSQQPHSQALISAKRWADRLQLGETADRRQPGKLVLAHWCAPAQWERHLRPVNLGVSFAQDISSFFILEISPSLNILLD